MMSYQKPSQMPMRPKRGTDTGMAAMTPEQKIQQMLATGQITPEQAAQMIANMRAKQAGAMPVRGKTGV